MGEVIEIGAKCRECGKLATGSLRWPGEDRRLFCDEHGKAFVASVMGPSRTELIEQVEFAMRRITNGDMRLAFECLSHLLRITH